MPDPDQATEPDPLDPGEASEQDWPPPGDTAAIEIGDLPGHPLRAQDATALIAKEIA